MRKKISKKFLIYFLVFILFCVAIISYAQISSINMSVNGNANSTGIKSTDDFKVKFNSIIIDNNIQPSGVTVSGTLDGNDEHKASFQVTGLTGYQDEATLKFEILNYSTYFSANLTSLDIIDNNTSSIFSSEYFSVTKELKNNNNETITKINPGESAYLIIKVKVIKVPTQQAQTADIIVSINAESDPYRGE